MNYYIKVLTENYANFEGRARRAEYWNFILIHSLIAIGLQILSAFIEGFSILFFIYSIELIVPGLAVLVRRLHDTNKSGWYYFISLIPLIGGIWLFILTVTEGDNFTNVARKLVSSAMS